MKKVLGDRCSKHFLFVVEFKNNFCKKTTRIRGGIPLNKELAPNNE
ncbi:hypothetical protein [[Bacillus] enclensis]|nr:hypothetical protein [[Bacillus] enclensis]MBH9967605.1 hypothetical protein [[Bacillus] enclensis]QWC23232.1 hypothetical protein KJK41_02290 [Bacillus haikouensis]